LKESSWLRFCSGPSRLHWWLIGPLEGPSRLNWRVIRPLEFSDI
jgi:hypothetical protein